MSRADELNEFSSDALNLAARGKRIIHELEEQLKRADAEVAQRVVEWVIEQISKSADQQEGNA